MTSPIRPVSDEHRHEPADYELEPNELAACPFCGGEPKRITLTADDGEGNEGGDVITCTRCFASSRVEFGRKENLVAAWNQRTALATRPKGDARGAVVWLRELAASCKATAQSWFGRGCEDEGQEWRVRGESYAFIADQIEGGHSPLTVKCGDSGAPLCRACSAPITELVQEPGCGGPLTALTQAPRSCCEAERERWEPYHTGTALSFEPGVFNLNRSGSASIAVRESEIEWETDYEGGATYLVINLPAGEAEAIRKWLNEWLPVPATAIRRNSHD